MAELETPSGPVSSPEDPAPERAKRAWTWLKKAIRRRRTRPEPPPSRCVIIGPSASGKTLLLSSLTQCANRKSHSYARAIDGKTMSVSPPVGRSPDFHELEDRVDGYFRRGLSLDTSKLEDCLMPEFSLDITVSTAGGRVQRRWETRFRTFDGAGGLLVDRGQHSRDPGFRKCRALLEEALEDCETVLLCLPIYRQLKLDQQAALQDLIHDFRRHPRIRQIVVCFTMYELLGRDKGRAAFRILANRPAARNAMITALRRQLTPVDISLEQLDGSRIGLFRAERRRVWCTPVSAFGFIPGNGGVNLMQVDGEDLLRTLPDDNFKGIDSPYPYALARHEYWRPFLTIDPFAFIATGIREGTLIHAYSELRA